MIENFIQFLKKNKIEKIFIDECKFSIDLKIGEKGYPRLLQRFIDEIN